VTRARVLIADDNEVYRKTLGRFISGQQDLELVGEAVDGLMAVAMASELTPDVVVMDLRMPGIDGFEATRRMKEAVPSAHVVAITAHRTDQDESDSIAAGAEAFVPKSRADTELIEVIRDLAESHSIPSAEAEAHVAGRTGEVRHD
jgi:DNA-binding NarL/FixJ family response regulator